MYRISFYLILLFGLLPFSLRTITLMLGFENTYKEQEKRLEKLSRRTDKQRVKSSYFKVRAKMSLVTILYWAGILISTVGLIKIIQGGIMVTKAGKIAGAVLGTLSLGLILYLSIHDFTDALKENKSDEDSDKTGSSGRSSRSDRGSIGIKNSIKINQGKANLSTKSKGENKCKVTEPTYVKIPVPLREDPIREIPKSTVETIGDTSVINIEKLGFTTTASRKPFFRKSDAADKLIAQIKNLYKEDMGTAQA